MTFVLCHEIIAVSIKNIMTSVKVSIEAVHVTGGIRTAAVHKYQRVCMRHSLSEGARIGVWNHPLRHQHVVQYPKLQRVQDPAVEAHTGDGDGGNFLLF